MSKVKKKVAVTAAKRGRFGGFLFGAVVGAVTGLLVAPKAGKETRAQLFGEGVLGAQADRLKGLLGGGLCAGADQDEELERKIEETRERLRSEIDAVGEGEPPA